MLASGTHRADMVWQEDSEIRERLGPGQPGMQEPALRDRQQVVRRCAGHAAPTLSGSHGRVKFEDLHHHCCFQGTAGRVASGMASQLSRLGRRGVPLLQQLERAAPGAVQQFSSAAETPAAGGPGRGAGRGSGGRGPPRSGGRVRRGQCDGCLLRWLLQGRSCRRRRVPPPPACCSVRLALLRMYGFVW